MAQANVRPTVDLAAGREVLAATLPRVLAAIEAPSLGALGWGSPNPNTLIIPMRGALGGAVEDYLLKLHFRTAQDWPPSAQFVNPATLSYEVGRDRHHLPDIRSPEAQMHPEYQNPSGGMLQLICCSATFEYYDVLHPVQAAHHLWQCTNTFLVTLSAIERAMAQDYHGRCPPNG